MFCSLSKVLSDTHGPGRASCAVLPTFAAYILRLASDPALGVSRISLQEIQSVRHSKYRKKRRKSSEDQ